MRNKGITLVALIVTVIILLILAGITLSALVGEDGIIVSAIEGRESSEKLSLKEELYLEIMNIEAKRVMEGGDITREDLIDLDRIGAEITSIKIPSEGEYKDYYFEIDEEYNVIILDKVTGEQPTITAEVITEGPVSQGDKVEIRVTSSVSDCDIRTIEVLNGAELKTDVSSTEKIFTVEKNGTYYFRATSENGRSKMTKVIVNIIKEAPAIKIIDIDEHNFTISIKSNYAEGLVTEYKYYVGGVLKYSGTTDKTYVVTGLESGILYENIYVEAYFGSSKLRSNVESATTISYNAPIITASETNWTKDDITVEADFQTSNPDFQKEISIDNGVTYESYTGAVTISKNTTVKARLTTSSGNVLESELEIKNIDKLAPKTFTPTVSDIASLTSVVINASNADDADATLDNGKSGIKEYKYYVYKGEALITTSEKITDSSWEATGLTAGNTYDIYVEAWDNAGNCRKSDVCSYEKPNLYVWNQYTAEIGTTYSLEVSSVKTELVRTYSQYAASYEYGMGYKFNSSTGNFVETKNRSYNEIRTFGEYFQDTYINYTNYTASSTYGTYYLCAGCTTPDAISESPYVVKVYGYKATVVSESTYTKKTFIGTVTSTDINAYPDGGGQGDYYYELVK